MKREALEASTVPQAWWRLSFAGVEVSSRQFTIVPIYFILNPSATLATP